MKLAALLIGLTSVFGGCYFFYAYSPYDSSLFPRCTINENFGIQCPGCGSQRAIHDLLHLRLGAALKSNPLAMSAIPYLFLLYISDLKASSSPWWARIRKIIFSKNAVWVILVTIALFTVSRNVA